MKRSMALAVAAAVAAAAFVTVPSATAASRRARHPWSASRQARHLRSGAVASGGATVVLDWNRALLRLVRTPGTQPATVHPTRSFAVMHAAISRHGTGLVTTARLFAVLNLAIADDVIAFYDAKYHYAVWRPVTAIREADGDGNPATTGDPNWMPLSATPADPSYPGAHSAVSAAAATVLSGFFGNWDRLTVTSEAVPGTFPGYRAAATEAGLSRIAAGVHTRTDHDAGTRLGRRVAAYVLRQWRSTWAGKLGR